MFTAPHDTVSLLCSHGEQYLGKDHCEQDLSQRNGVNQNPGFDCSRLGTFFPLQKYLGILFLLVFTYLVSLCYFPPPAKMSTSLGVTASKRPKLENLLAKSTTLCGRTLVVFVTTVFT